MYDSSLSRSSFTNTFIHIPPESRSMSDKVDEFEDAVEEETEHDIWVDQHMGDDIGWFFVDSELEFQGETFDAELDFNLSEEDISVLYAEITIDDEDERKSILEEETSLLDAGGDDLLYEYYPEENEVQDLVDGLREVHSGVFY